MTLQAEDIADLITTTQRDLGKLRWTDLSYDLQEYIAMPMLLQKEKVTFQSGHGIQWNIMTGTSGAAKDVGLYEVDNVNVADVMTTANVPWRHLTTNYAIERREIAMNTGAAQIVELVRIRRNDAMIDLAKHMEQRFWSKPADNTDTKRIFGVPYWISYGSSTDTEGFEGGNPNGFSGGAAGLPVATVPNWQNYSANYTSISNIDLIRKWRKAGTFTNFKPPVAGNPYMTGDRYGYYTSYAVIGPLEEYLESQNDNLGNDIASKDGKLLFRQVPVNWVPQLEGRTGAPIYGINWASLRVGFLSGEYMREEGPRAASNQHTVFQTHIDTTMNLYCNDRRRNFVLATADPDDAG
jgi:hypothetical protein